MTLSRRLTLREWRSVLESSLEQQREVIPRFQNGVAGLGAGFHGATGSAAQPPRRGEMRADFIARLAREVIAAFGPIQAAASESAPSAFQ